MTSVSGGSRLRAAVRPRSKRLPLTPSWRWSCWSWPASPPALRSAASLPWLATWRAWRRTDYAWRRSASMTLWWRLSSSRSGRSSRRSIPSLPHAAHRQLPEALHRLSQRQRSIAGARRKIDDEVVELAPMNVGEHLLDRPRHHWSAPDHRLVRAGEEADRHEPDAESLERYELGVHHLRLALDAHHARDRRTVDVGIEQPDPGPAATERAGEIYRHRGLADASLSGRDRDPCLTPGSILSCRRTL